jgi:hypothetical protein
MLTSAITFYTSITKLLSFYNPDVVLDIQLFPDDVLVQIFLNLNNIIDLNSVIYVCKRWSILFKRKILLEHCNRYAITEKQRSVLKPNRPIELITHHRYGYLDVKLALHEDYNFIIKFSKIYIKKYGIYSMKYIRCKPNKNSMTIGLYLVTTSIDNRYFNYDFIKNLYERCIDIFNPYLPYDCEKYLKDFNRIEYIEIKVKKGKNILFLLSHNNSIKSQSHKIHLISISEK